MPFLFTPLIIILGSLLPLYIGWRLLKGLSKFNNKLARENAHVYHSPANGIATGMWLLFGALFILMGVGMVALGAYWGKSIYDGHEIKSKMRASALRQSEQEKREYARIKGIVDKLPRAEQVKAKALLQRQKQYADRDPQEIIKIIDTHTAASLYAYGVDSDKLVKEDTLEDWMALIRYDRSH